MMSSKVSKNIFAFAFGLVCVAALVGITEGICFYLNQRDHKIDFYRQLSPAPTSRSEIDRKFEITAGTLKLPIVSPNPTSWSFRPNRKKVFQFDRELYEWGDRGFFQPVVGPVRATVNDLASGRQIYDVTYTMDEHHRRITYIPKEEPPFSALFLGGSFVFGEGLEDADTLPYQFGLIDPDFRTYNLAFRGYGPNSVLLRLQREDLRSTISPKGGVSFYFFINDHINRALGSLDGYSWRRRFPYYEVEPSGQYQLRGSFSETFPFRDWLFLLLEQSEFFRFFQINLPLQITDSHLEYVTGLFSAIRDEIKRQLPEQEFVLVFHPLPAPIWTNRLISFLEKAKINYLDYSDVPLSKYLHGPAGIPGDGHPTSEMNRVFAKLLRLDIRSWTNCSSQLCLKSK